MPSFLSVIAALPSATNWFAGLATGSIATSFAIIAIALVGLGMLQGRIDVRRGAATILGCFLLFGAPAIAAALMNLDRSEQAVPVNPTEPSINSAANSPTVPQAQPDPYAGASLVR